MIKAIQTRYKGYHFRSRLEARWAVFFDALGLEWEYEPEGFDLGNGVWYLPDFKIKVDDSSDWCWFEVKGQKATKTDLDKLQRLCDGTGMHGYISSGTMDVPVLEKCRKGKVKYNGSKIYWRFPAGSLTSLTSKGEGVADDFINIENNSICAFYQSGDDKICIDHVYLEETIDENNLGKAGTVVFVPNKNGEMVDICEALKSKDCNFWVVHKILENGKLVRSFNSGNGRFYRSKILKTAYAKARQARFEHGETPL